MSGDTPLGRALLAELRSLATKYYLDRWRVGTRTNRKGEQVVALLFEEPGSPLAAIDRPKDQRQDSSSQHWWRAVGLRARVREGSLNFGRLAERLINPGYVLEVTEDGEFSMGSPSMEAARQDEFDELFRVLFPGQGHSVELSCAATDEGAERGAFAYILFNKSVLDYSDAIAILRAENMKSAAAERRRADETSARR